MVIQCPECKSRYRAKNFKPNQPAARIKCPKCVHVFTFDPASAAAESKPVAKKTPSVLAVDDARFFREILTEILTPLQIQLVTVGTAEEALAAMSQQSFGLVLVDLNLPDMSGLDLMKKIRSGESAPGVKLLAMSGAYRRDDCEADAIQAGADGFLNKSFKPEDLQKKIRELLA